MINIFGKEDCKGSRIQFCEKKDIITEESHCYTFFWINKIVFGLSIINVYLKVKMTE